MGKLPKKQGTKHAKDPRHVIFQMRVNLEERRLLKSAAAKVGLPVAQFIREKALAS